jgi:hypothetical protein
MPRRPRVPRTSISPNRTVARRAACAMSIAGRYPSLVAFEVQVPVTSQSDVGSSPGELLVLGSGSAFSVDRDCASLAVRTSRGQTLLLDTGLGNGALIALTQKVSAHLINSEHGRRCRLGSRHRQCCQRNKSARGRSAERRCRERFMVLP